MFRGTTLRRFAQIFTITRKEIREKNIHVEAIREIGTDEAQRTLGDLFKATQKKEYFTEAERKKINKAIKERNFLIHSYWNKRIEYAVKPEGREWLIHNLDELRDLIRSSTAIVNSLIDHYLEQYGVNVQYFADKTTEVWKSDSEPPTELLH